MTLAYSGSGKKDLRVATYSAFSGLDTSRPEANQENQRNLHLSRLNEAATDWRGQIVRDAPYTRQHKSPRATHVRFYSDGSYVWVFQDKSGKFGAQTSKGNVITDVWDNDEIVTSAVFDRKPIFFSRDKTPLIFNGSVFDPATSGLKAAGPAFGTTVSRRLCVAGSTQYPTRVDVSRLDTLYLYDDEKSGETSALRAGRIDVANIIGTSDKITGLSSFEQDRLVVFTNDRAIIYAIDPDISAWTIDERANIMIGCLSHNTIARAGVDLIFCSRSGVNHIQRSPDNGILVYSRSLSDKVDILYRRLVRSVDDPRRISACFDPDEGRYHIFFPSKDGMFAQRLSLSLNPEEDQVRPSWSMGTAYNFTCGDFLAGQLVLGGAGGVYLAGKPEDTQGEAITSDILTPVLWLNNQLDTKDTHSLILQAHGSGHVDIEAYDDKGKLLWSKDVEISGDDDGQFDDVPLIQSYEIPMQLRARGFRLRFQLRGPAGLMRISGFAITYRV